MIKDRRDIWEHFLFHSVIYGLLLLFHNVLVTGLKMENVFVPESGLHGGSETLKCNFELESDQLLSLKWYKNDNEFYRYLPNTRQNIETFPMPGFTVQKNNATLHEVTIRNLTLDAIGIYKCEVSADKTFQTLVEERSFTVIVPPVPESPKISNISSTVHMGDTISGNCTSFRSKPPAQLTFHINDEKVDALDVKEYSPVSENSSRGGEEMQVYTSTLALRFQIDNKHFRQGVVTLKCIATIGKLKWVTEKKIGHRNFPNQFSSPSQHSFGTRRTEVNDHHILFVGIFSLATAATTVRLHFSGFIVGC